MDGRYPGFGTAEQVLRVAFASRLDPSFAAAEFDRHVQRAADRNATRGISGVILCQQGRVLQWLEGPGVAVCALMSRIATDPRHADVTTLAAGWTDARRFGAWPLLRAFDPGLWFPKADRPLRDPELHAIAAAAFDEVAIRQRRGGSSARGRSGLGTRLAGSLCRGGDHHLPSARIWGDPRLRAGVVDETLRCLGTGQQDGSLASHRIALALSRLNGLVQRGGRVPDPAFARLRVCVVLPPGGSQILGAIVKADLLRAAGISVRLVLEATDATALQSLAAEASAPILIAGSRLSADSAEDRAQGFATWLGARLPGRLILTGGRRSGPLSEWPERLAFHLHATGAMDARNVDWAALGCISAMVGGDPAPGPQAGMRGRERGPGPQRQG